MNKRHEIDPRYNCRTDNARAIQNIYRLYKKINDLLNIKAIYTVSGINQNRFSGGSEYDYV